MVSVTMPMMIFILASGYLLIVYLLLALAKRGTNKIPPRVNLQLSDDDLATEVTVHRNVTEMINH